MSIKVGLSGAIGRMGRRVGAALAAMEGVDFTCGLVRSSGLAADGCVAPLVDDAQAAIDHCDVLMDFTDVDRTFELSRLCAAAGRPVFVGTTMRTEADLDTLRKIAIDIPIICAPNVTRGAATLFGILEELARRLGPDYDAKVLGLHHRAKKEVPSGTSGEIARRIRTGRGDDAPPEIATVLAGGTYGTHEALFAGPNDEIRITHTVTRPDIDVTVLRAGLDWLMSKPAGFYGISEVLAE